jgi:hypothetical protein
MKTTLLLPDPLMARAKSFSKRKGISMTKLMEESLRAYLMTESKKVPKQKWEPLVSKPRGGYVEPDLEGNWPKIRDIIYEPRL